MRTLYNPIDMVKKLFGGGGGGSQAPSGPSASELRAKEDQAREEASRRAASDAQTRQSARSSLITDANLADTFGSTSTKKKSLFGA